MMVFANPSDSSHISEDEQRELLTELMGTLHTPTSTRTVGLRYPAKHSQSMPAPMNKRNPTVYLAKILIWLYIDLLEQSLCQVVVRGCVFQSCGVFLTFSSVA